MVWYQRGQGGIIKLQKVLLSSAELMIHKFRRYTNSQVQVSHCAFLLLFFVLYNNDLNIRQTKQAISSCHLWLNYVLTFKIQFHDILMTDS